VVSGWLATRYPHLTVDAVDVQSQAVACTQWTLERAGINGSVWPSDGFASVQKQYPLIVTNPPFHDGMRTDPTMAESFIRDAARHLSPGGELRLVANSFLPYMDVISRYIGHCEILSENNRFRVYRACCR
jgi:16S rRNA (guanine1207-N2)-methyltransferase